MTEGARVEGVIELSIRELRSLTSWSCDCAERSQAIFRRARPEDERVALALAAARDFARGGPRNNHLRKLAMAAFRARAEIKGPAASAAAEAASHAAASAFLHPINKAHQVLHILGAAACASWALAESGEVGLADALNAAFTEAPLEIIALPSQLSTCASDGMRQSPRGERATMPTFGPSAVQERLNWFFQKRERKTDSQRWSACGS
jgi:hypothetical protein